MFIKINLYKTKRLTIVVTSLKSIAKKSKSVYVTLRYVTQTTQSQNFPLFYVLITKPIN